MMARAIQSINVKTSREITPPVMALTIKTSSKSTIKKTL